MYKREIQLIRKRFVEIAERNMDLTDDSRSYINSRLINNIKDLENYKDMQELNKELLEINQLIDNIREYKDNNKEDN